MLNGYLGVWLAGSLARWPAGPLACWLASWLGGSISWLAGWLAGGLAGRRARSLARWVCVRGRAGGLARSLAGGLAGYSPGPLTHSMHVRKSERACACIEGDRVLVAGGAHRHHPGMGGAGGRAVGVRLWLCSNGGGQGERSGLFAGLSLCCPLYWHTSPTRPADRGRSAWKCRI